jgi:hypothetical protein
MRSSKICWPRIAECDHPEHGGELGLPSPVLCAGYWHRSLLGAGVARHRGGAVRERMRRSKGCNDAGRCRRRGGFRSGWALCEVASYADESMDVPTQGSTIRRWHSCQMRKTLGPDACAAGEASARALDYDDDADERSARLAQRSTYTYLKSARAANFESMQARASRRPPTARRSPPNWRA